MSFVTCIFVFCKEKKLFFSSLNEKLFNENKSFEEGSTHDSGDAEPNWQVSTHEDAIFRATVSNMKPEEVFNHPRYSGSRSRSESLRSQESPTRRSSRGEAPNQLAELGEMTNPPEAKDDQESTSLMRNNSLNLNTKNRIRGFRQRQASDSYLLRNVRQLELTKFTLGSTQELSPSSEVPEQIFINDVPTPPFPNRTPSKSGPTAPDKRVLDQKEFDKKLKAKRAIFSKGRSMSLASFKLPSRLKKSEKSPKSQKYKYYEKELEEKPSPKGELDFLNMEQLINIKDIQHESGQRIG
jgi:hypothetical protein